MARARTTTSTRRPRKRTAAATPRRTSASSRRSVTEATAALTEAGASPRTPVPTASAADGGSAANVADLAGGLRSFLDAIETEVRAVSALTKQIDDLVGQLNAARAEQAERLLALDALQASAKDGGLTSFLDKLIRPRMPRVAEVVPERLA